MGAYPVESALAAGAKRVVIVVGHGRAQVEEALHSRFAGIETSLQPVQRGTGDAVRCGLELLNDYRGWVLVIHGDCPLIQADVLFALLDKARTTEPKVALVTSELQDPTGYGRIIRDKKGRIVSIKEHRDCTPEELKTREVNPALYVFHSDFLRESINALEANNDQGELYLTDIIARAAKSGKDDAVASITWDMSDLRGINDRYELALCENILRQRIIRAHAVAGVTFRDPSSTYVDRDVVIAPDATIEPNVVLRGKTEIAEGVRIDAGSVLDNVRVAKDAFVKPYTVATNSSIGEKAQIGPFSHLRPDSDIGPDAHIGNFVETKKTRLARGAKANHLAYLGDGVIGEDVNVGAGTIFCNYDGFRKHVTVLEDGCFIGSDSQLVAPVRIGKGAYVATGTTVTRDVPDEALALSRVRQENKDGYAPKLRARLKSG